MGSSVTVTEAGVFAGRFDVEILPSNDQATSAPWNFFIERKETSDFRLVLLRYLEEPREGLQAQLGNYGSSSDCGPRSIAKAYQFIDGAEICKEVLGKEENGLVLRIPPRSEIEAMSADHRRTIRSLLNLVVTATWSNSGGGSTPTAITEDIFAAAPDASEVVGWSPNDTPLWRQLLVAVTDAAPPRQASNATNGVRPLLFQSALLLIAVTAAIGLARPLFLRFARSKGTSEDKR
jgi:hypothetical protein